MRGIEVIKEFLYGVRTELGAMGLEYEGPPVEACAGDVYRALRGISRILDTGVTGEVAILRLPTVYKSGNTPMVWRKNLDDPVQRTKLVYMRAQFEDALSQRRSYPEAVVNSFNIMIQEAKVNG